MPADEGLEAGNSGVSERELGLVEQLEGAGVWDQVKRAVDRLEDYLYANQSRLQIRSVYSYYNESGEAQSSILLTEDVEDERPSSDIADEILAEILAATVSC